MNANVIFNFKPNYENIILKIFIFNHYFITIKYNNGYSAIMVKPLQFIYTAFKIKSIETNYAKRCK